MAPRKASARFWPMLVCYGLAGSAGCGASAFECQSDVQCIDGDRWGRCWSTGYCAFPDSVCEHGHRYGRHARSDLAGRCVHSDEGDPASSTTAAFGTSGSYTSGAGSVSDSSNEDATTSSAGMTMGAPPDVDAPSDAERLDPDLLAWYRFEGELEGIVEDSTENDLHGTCVSCPEKGAGMVVGQGAHFDGKAQSVVLPGSGAFDFAGGFTLAVWARVDSWLPTARMILGRPFGADNRNSWEVFVRFSEGKEAVFYQLGDTPISWVGTSVVPSAPYDWMHIALTWDGADAVAYLDGEARATFSVAQIVYDEHQPRIGSDVDYGEEVHFFAGALDDVRFYERALSESEVAELAAGR